MAVHHLISQNALKLYNLINIISMYIIYINIIFTVIYDAGCKLEIFKKYLRSSMFMCYTNESQQTLIQE